MSFPPKYEIDDRKRRPRRAAEETRRQIVDVAVDQIAEVGFHRMSIADVALESNISQSGLLHHFRSKAALLAAVLERREHDDNEFLFGDGTVPLGWAAFDALIALAARNSTRPEWVAVFVRVSAEAIEPGHPAHDWLRRHYASVRSWLMDAVDHGKATGTIRRDAPAALIVRNTIAVMDGIQQQWLLEPADIVLIDQIQTHIEALKSAWATTPAD